MAGFGGMVSGIVSGYLTDRFGRKETAIIGLLALLLVFIAYTLPFWHKLVFCYFFHRVSS